jgi:hypothetical protein
MGMKSLPAIPAAMRRTEAAAVSSERSFLEERATAGVRHGLRHWARCGACLKRQRHGQGIKAQYWCPPETFTKVSSAAFSSSS